MSLVIPCTVTLKSLRNELTVGKRSGAFLDVILARRLGATFASTLTPFCSCHQWEAKHINSALERVRVQTTQPWQTQQENHVNSSEFSSLRGSGRIKRRHTAAQRAWNSIGLFTSSSIGLAHSGSSLGKRRTNRGAKSKRRLWRRCANISFLKIVVSTH